MVKLPAFLVNKRENKIIYLYLNGILLWISANSKVIKVVPKSVSNVCHSPSLLKET